MKGLAWYWGRRWEERNVYSQMELYSAGRIFGSRYERIGTEIGNLLKIKSDLPLLNTDFCWPSHPVFLHSCKRWPAAIKSLASILVSIGMLNKIGTPVTTMLAVSRSPLSPDSRIMSNTTSSGLKDKQTILNAATKSCLKILVIEVCHYQGHHLYGSDDATSYWRLHKDYYWVAPRIISSHIKPAARINVSASSAGNTKLVITHHHQFKFEGFLTLNKSTDYYELTHVWIAEGHMTVYHSCCLARKVHLPFP